MAVTYMRYQRLQHAIQEWLASNATLVTLLSYNSSTNMSIFVSAGDDDISNPPLLIIDDIPSMNYFPDVDSVQVTYAHLSAYANSRLEVDNIIGAVAALAAQNETTQKDASFSSNNIETLGIKVDRIDPKIGDTQLGVTVAHRAQVPVTDFHTGGIVLEITWRET